MRIAVKRVVQDGFARKEIGRNGAIITQSGSSPQSQLIVSLQATYEHFIISISSIDQFSESFPC